MKIFYLIANSEGKFPNIKIWYTKASSFIEANKIERGAIDKKTDNFIKVLVENKDFESDISVIRRSFDIPANGYSFEQWDNIKKSKKTDETYPKWRLELDKACRGLVTKYNIPFLLHENLTYIVVGNFIYLPLTNLYLQGNLSLLPVYDGPSVEICICGHTSKNQLINFIKNNWSDIEKETKVFTDKASTYVSTRDLEIVQLRDKKKMKFREIADYLSEQTGNFDINEDMIKKAYHRAIDTTTALKK